MRWGCVLGKNEVGLQREEFKRGSLPQLPVFERPPASVDSDVVVFRPPELLEFLPECGQVSLKFRVALSMRHQHTDAAHPFGLLRNRREWPSYHRSAEKLDELAPPHVPPEEHACAIPKAYRNKSSLTSRPAKAICAGERINRASL